MPKINPFTKEDYLEVWLDSDPNFEVKKRQAFTKFKQDYLPKKSFILNIIMTIQNSLKTLHISSTFAVLSLVIGVTLFGLVGGAQSFASNEYKPSTLLQNVFGANKQKERDPNQKLVADSANGLVELNDCNLRIKYPKQYLGTEVEMTTGKMVNNNHEDEFVKELLDNADRLDREWPTPPGEYNMARVESTRRNQQWQNLKNKNVKSQVESVLLEAKSLKPEDPRIDYSRLFSATCYNPGKASLKEIVTYINGGNFDSLYSLTVAELRQLTGWFITDKNITEIFIQPSFMSENGVADRTVYFQYKNIIYQISGVSSVSKIKFPAITGEEASKQYDNLVKQDGDPFDLKNKFGHDIQVQFID